MPAAPSAEAQLTFLTKLQRLFAEGSFVATYKFALLMALADLALEYGDDTGPEIELSLQEIAQRFVALYWRHAAPYGHGSLGATPGVLVQNYGSQAAVITAVAAFRAETGATTALQARAFAPQYQRLLKDVAGTVSSQPLKYLQNFGGATDPFLYVRSGRGKVRLQPGATYCLRRFYPLVQQLARSHWVEHVKSNRQNAPILGGPGDLEDFLFSTSRQSLSLVGAELRKLDGDRCFYCGSRLAGEVDVDHYIPFATYPRDLAQNFVLAHANCNRSKSDSLAGRPHLERWLERLVQRGAALAEIGERAGIVCSGQTASSVAGWAYRNAALAAGRAWLAPATYETIEPSYLRLFSATGDLLVLD